MTSEAISSASASFVFSPPALNPFTLCEINAGRTLALSGSRNGRMVPP
jgi:hypothetical protein